MAWLVCAFFFGLARVRVLFPLSDFPVLQHAPHSSCTFPAPILESDTFQGTPVHFIGEEYQDLDARCTHGIVCHFFQALSADRAKKYMSIH